SLLSRAGEGIWVDRAELRALARAHLEERLLETLREALLLTLEVEQPLRIEPLDVRLHRTRPDVGRHHVDTDVLLEQEARQVVHVAARQLGVGRRRGAGEEQERQEQRPGPGGSKHGRGAYQRVAAARSVSNGGSASETSCASSWATASSKPRSRSRCWSQ